MHKNSLCPPGSSCGKWEASSGSVDYLENGCILSKYCGTKGNYMTKTNVLFSCPDKTPNAKKPTTPTTPGSPTICTAPKAPTTSAVAQVGPCTVAKQNLVSNPKRVSECSSFGMCMNL